MIDGVDRWTGVIDVQVPMHVTQTKPPRKGTPVGVIPKRPLILFTDGSAQIPLAGIAAVEVEQVIGAGAGDGAGTGLGVGRGLGCGVGGGTGVGFGAGGIPVPNRLTHLPTHSRCHSAAISYALPAV